MPTEARPEYFDTVHDILQIQASALLPGEWKEADTLAFLKAYGPDPADYDSQEEFEEVVREYADDHLESKLTFPHDIALQQMVAESSISPSELKLFAQLHTGIKGDPYADEDADENIVEKFITTLRNESFTGYCIYDEEGEVLQSITEVATALSENEVANLMAESENADFVNRLTAGGKLWESKAYDEAKSAAVHGSEDLIEAIHDGYVTNKATHDDFEAAYAVYESARMNSDVPDERLDKIKETLKYAFDYDSPTEAFTALAKVINSQNETLLSGIENELIDSHEVLDGFLDSSTSTQLKPQKRRI